MDLKEQLQQQHQETLSLLGKMTGSLSTIGASAELDPEIKLGGGGVGVGFTSPYVTFKVADNPDALGNDTQKVLHQFMTEGTSPEKGLASTVANILNAAVQQSQNYNAGTLVRANGDSVNVNVEAVSAALRNNPQMEGMLENFGKIVHNSVAAQVQQQMQGAAQQQKPEVSVAMSETRQVPQRVPTKKGPIGFAPNKVNAQGSWADKVEASAQSANNERGR